MIELPEFVILVAVMFVFVFVVNHFRRRKNTPDHRAKDESDE